MNILNKDTTRKLGHHYETLALKYFKTKGLTLVERNFTCKLGEIDLIFTDKNMIIFVEVRFRKNKHYGSAPESVLKSKQLKITNTAKIFLQKNKLFEKVICRFDILGIELVQNRPEYHWIKNAFP